MSTFPLRLAAAVLCTFILSACSTTIFRLEKAAAAPMEKVATIVVSKVALRYVDNRIFDLCTFDEGLCGVQVLPGEHKLQYNVYTTEYARDRGRSPNRNSLHNRISRLKFEHSVQLQEGMVYELSFNEEVVKSFKENVSKNNYPIEMVRGEIGKYITFKAYENKDLEKMVSKIKKSKIIRTSEYRPDI
ncbi:MAG: hypothetical protein OEZ68_12690 [Gammaproteobacteria bacterium]|nr:hypothetical protein [Gammaproteobacteria bacterium]MDH5801654.1 hypothetical protein [Gammaproteobacteria bacterium]